MTYDDLSTEQQEFIDTALSGKDILVDACIGSGKTTSIQILCDNFWDKDVLYLTYNRLLKLDAKEKITDGSVLVQNYNGFAFICLKRAGVSCGISDQFQMFNKVKPKIPKKYDVLIIDEYQDIEAEMTKMLWHIKESCPGIQIIAVGDMDQKIYDKTVLDVPAFMDDFLAKDYVKMNFTRCFRLSKDIAARYGNIWNKPIIGVNEKCQVDIMSPYDVNAFLANQDPKNILCLGARTGQMSRTLNWLETYRSDKFNKSTVYASISDNNKGSVEPDGSVAIFTTFDSSKGMERPICVVFDYNEEYWGTRKNMPNANAEILRNIFCVAGSRGKERIIFVDDPKKHMIKDSTLVNAKDGCNKHFDKPFMASEMFDFKYREDVEHMYQMLKFERDDIEGAAHDIIKIDNTDEMIDLSPCIGNYQEASFFKNYDIDADIKLASKVRDTRPKYRTENPDLKEKILALAAIDTKYQRYITQANIDFVSDDQTKLIHDRLRLVFDGSEIVQKDGSVEILADNNDILTFNGRLDVIDKNGVIYELKFKDELAHENFLQLAFYLITNNAPYGYLWNIKNNERYKVYAPDESKFLKELTKTVTKHAHYSGKLLRKSDSLRHLDRFEKKKIKK